MSIANTIVELEKGGHLIRFIPPRTRQAPKRRLFLTKPAQEEIYGDKSAIAALHLKGHIVAALTRWALGERVFADEKGRPKFLKRLDPPPPEVWEIRVTDPIPQARILCRFAEPDTLIVTQCHTRGYLGDRGSHNWNAAMASCVTAWTTNFEDAPFDAPSIHDYVTSNCDDFKI